MVFEEKHHMLWAYEAYEEKESARYNNRPNNKKKPYRKEEK